MENVCAAVVACCNPPPVLQPGKQVLDLVPHSVEPFAIWNRLVAVASGWNAGCNVLLRQKAANCVAVISLVADQRCSWWKISQQHFSASEITALTFRSDEAVLDVPGGRTAHMVFAVSVCCEFAVHTSLGPANQPWF